MRFLHCLCSQSLFTLSLIEEYLGKRNIPGTEETWIRNRNYFRKIVTLTLFTYDFDLLERF